MEAPTPLATRTTYKPKNESHPMTKKLLAVHRVIDLGWTPTEAAKEAKVDRQNVANWVKLAENNKPLQDYSHRPPACSPEKKKELLDEIEKKRKKGQVMYRDELHTQLQKKVKETCTQANKPLKNITSRFTRDFIKEQHLHTGNAEVMTNAHEVAIDDPRHAASFAALIKNMHDRVPKGQFMNMDKTSFDYIKTKKENQPAVYSGQRPQSFKIPTPKSSNRPKGNCSVPMYVIASDGGKVGDVVYLIKDNAMKIDEIDTYSAPMLEVSNGPGATAHIVFYREFTTNTDAALEWVYHNVVVPFANQLRAGPGRKADSFVSLNLDGDPRQLQVTAQENVVGLFSHAKILVGKSPASCTPIFQPLDAGKLFLAAKKRFSKLIESDEETLNDEDREELKAIFREHRRKYPEKTSKKGVVSQALGAHFTDVLKCLPAIAVAMREIPLRHVIMDSFRDTGVQPFSPSIIRSRCTYEWTSAQEAQFDIGVLELSKRIGVNFELKESDFEECGIPANNKPKDGVPVHMRRALYLHGPPILQALREQAARSKND